MLDLISTKNMLTLFKVGVVVRSYNPSTWEAEAEES
jgi:hypothetical protein